MMDIKVGFNNMKASIVHHAGDELSTRGCETICVNPGHRAVVGPIVSCQVTKHTYQPNFDLWSNVLCPKKMGHNWFRMDCVNGVCT
jgi:hypothetical protein